MDSIIGDHVLWYFVWSSCQYMRECLRSWESLCRAKVDYHQFSLLDLALSLWAIIPPFSFIMSPQYSNWQWHIKAGMCGDFIRVMHIASHLHLVILWCLCQVDICGLTRFKRGTMHKFTLIMSLGDSLEINSPIFP